MSYPGYPYQQGQPQGMPGAYPQFPQQPPAPNQCPYPGGQAPYPQAPYSAYPPAPTSYPQAPYPNQYPSGFSFNPGPPSYMPQAYSMPMPPHEQSEYIPPPTQSNTYHSAPPTVEYATHSQPQSHAPKKARPTVFPAEPFDPRADAETLRKAMKGFGTDEKSIINVLAYRSNAQRLEIGRQFKTLYGKDLIKDLKSELSGRFEDLVVAMMTPLPQFYAKEVYAAISGIGTDEDTLIEVFCTMTNNEILTIRAAYEGIYGRSLEGDLMGDTSGTFRRLMVALCNANRDESMVVNPSGITQDAQALLRAGEMRMGTDESTFNAILCQRNYNHLKAVFDEYQRITGHDFEKAVKNEFSGDSEEGLLAIVRSVKDRPTFFAKRIHQSMKGMGTEDRQLIRLVVTRSEVDMGDIKEAYQAKYGKSLEDAISSDTSGDYKKCLVALVS